MDNVESIRVWVNEVWNRGNLRHLDDYMADECDIYGPTPKTITTAQYRAYVMLIRQRISGLYVKIESIMGEGQEVLLMSRISGRNTDTGAAVSFWAAHAFRLRHGKVAGVTRVWDLVEYLVETGHISASVYDDLALS